MGDTRPDLTKGGDRSCGLAYLQTVIVRLTQVYGTSICHCLILGPCFMALQSRPEGIIVSYNYKY